MSEPITAQQVNAASSRDTPHPSALANLRADFVTAEFCAGFNRHFFNSAFQLTTRFMGAEPPSPIEATMKRLPSGVTS